MIPCQQMRAVRDLSMRMPHEARFIAREGRDPIYRVRLFGIIYTHTPQILPRKTMTRTQLENPLCFSQGSVRKVLRRLGMTNLLFPLHRIFCVLAWISLSSFSNQSPEQRH